MMQQTLAAPGGLFRTFIRYVSRNVLSMLGLSLYIFADTYFISGGVGTNGIVALNLVLPMFNFMNGVGLMLGVGGGVRFAIERAKSGGKDCSHIFMQAVYAGSAIGLLITLAVLIFPREIVQLLGGSGDTIVGLGATYLSTILAFSIPFILNNILTAFVRNDGAPSLAMAAMLASSLSNIVLDYVFIFPCGLGMFGAAFASGLSPVISMCILSSHFIRGKATFGLRRVRLHFRELRMIFASGLSTFIGEFATGFVMMQFNFVILASLGEIGVGAYGIIANVAVVCIAVFNGVAQGMQPLASTFYGKGDLQRSKKLYAYGAGTALLIGTVFYVAGALFSHSIVNLFNSDGGVQLFQIAEQGIRLYFLAFFPMSVNVVTISFFASQGAAKESFLLSILKGIVFVLPLLYLLPSVMGTAGIWLTVPLAELITILLCGLLLVVHFKKKEAEFSLRQ